MSDARRTEWLVTIVATSFFVGIISANHLWISDRLYPLHPILNILSFLPTWIDYILSSLLVISLILAAISKKPRKYIIAALILTAFLFLEDQGRIFPSFYEYSLLFFILAFYSWKHDDQEKEKFVLNLCRVAIIFIYIWGGALKINPHFESQLVWVLTPLLNVVPFLRGSFIHWGALIAPFIEIEIGIGLLFKKTRTLALIEAIGMHAMLFFFIGPARSIWNEGAWAWNLASAFIVFILFYKTKGVSAKEILWGNGHGNENIKWNVMRIAVYILFGILPAFNLINLWGSSLSFNIYTGNVARASIYVEGSTGTKFPQPMQKYFHNAPLAGNVQYFFDLNQWSEDELHAEPYPDSQIFKNIAGLLCKYAVRSSDVKLAIQEKLTIFQKPNFFGGLQYYDCGDLGL